jgi:hypothetical protein
MPKPTLDNVLDVKDPMLNDNYEIIFPKIPGGSNQRALHIQCKTAIKPGTTLAEIEIELFGHKVMHAARRTWSNEMSLEFIEDRDGTITHELELWAEEIRARTSQHGQFKADYAVDAQFNIYDQNGKKAMEYKITGCWPSQVPDLSFDGSGGSAQTLGASFKFDHVERIDKKQSGTFAS